MLLLLSLSNVAGVQARIIIDGTRVIYPANKKEVILNLRNVDEAPSLVQAWLDTGHLQSMPGEDKVPFVLSPPLFRLDPGKGQTLRIVYTQDPLPTDRESLFWLNVMDIPPRERTPADGPSANKLEFAFKHRLKVFFRPTGLNGKANEAPAKLTWDRVSEAGGAVVLQATNPTPYHVNLNNVEVIVDGARLATRFEMVPPFSTKSFPIIKTGPLPHGALQVEYSYVNDFGGVSKELTQTPARP